MTFRVGQKVVCINDYDDQGRDFVARNGGIYTISRIIVVDRIFIDLLFDEISNPYGVGWCSENFRPVVDKTTDISFAIDILRKASNKVREPA